jgi:predicted SAM-dependent methyltransferase
MSFLLRSVLDFVLIHLRSYNRNRIRRNFSRRFIRGEGIEIGALHNPLFIPRHATVRYVDHLDNDQLRKHYPELSEMDIVPVTIVTPCETLEGIADSSQSFVIANHLIEHSQNPIAALQAWLRVLEPNGIIFMAVPDKRWTFDRDRPVTSNSHLFADFQDNGIASRASHYDQWVNMISEVVHAESARELEERNYSIHFHVWDKPAFDNFLAFCQRDFKMPFRIVDSALCKLEMSYILQKIDGVEQKH